MTDDDDEPGFPGRDRLPSEIFQALEAYAGHGFTQKELLECRRQAIGTLLEMLQEAYRGEPSRTLYDQLALEAWSEGLLPPDPKRGRPTPHNIEQTAQKFRIVKAISLYRRVRRIDPELKAEECAAAVAEKFHMDFETFWNLIRSSKTRILGKQSTSVFPDIQDMYIEWAATLRQKMP